MKKVESLTAFAYVFFAISFILFTVPEYKTFPIVSILLIIMQSFFFLYYGYVFVKKIKENKALSQTAELSHGVKETLDNWTTISFYVISIAFIVMFIIENRKMPVLSISTITIATAVLLFSTIERIKRGKNKANNK